MVLQKFCLFTFFCLFCITYHLLYILCLCEFSGKTFFLLLSWPYFMLLFVPFEAWSQTTQLYWLKKQTKQTLRFHDVIYDAKCMYVFISICWSECSTR